MGVLTGWLYCYLWCASIFAGYAGLFCPIFPIIFISNKLYRCITDTLFTFWQYYPTVLIELLCKCEIQISGDEIRTNETSILIMNHRTRTDWNFLWPTVYHSVVGKNRYRHPTKFVLKDVIRHIPGPGWVMQLACFIFIKRCWLNDKMMLQQVVEYYNKLKYKYSLIIFPEGTDFTESTKEKSNLYARKHNFQEYSYVLHPRTTGFTFLSQELLKRNNLDAVYDMTLIYPDLVPQNEQILFNGGFPKQIKIHLARYPSAVLPKTEQGLTDFLQKRWLDKEKTIKEYNMTGQFLHGQIIRTENILELYVALIFWTILPYIVLYFFIFTKWFRITVLAHTLILLVINFTLEGFQNFEIGIFNFKNKYF